MTTFVTIVREASPIVDASRSDPENNVVQDEDPQKLLIRSIKDSVAFVERRRLLL
jgi:hypothetical protein